MEHLQNETVYKKRYLQIEFLRKFKKQKLYFEPGDNGYKIRTSFKTLV